MASVAKTVQERQAELRNRRKERDWKEVTCWVPQAQVSRLKQIEKHLQADPVAPTMLVSMPTKAQQTAPAEAVGAMPDADMMGLAQAFQHCAVLGLDVENLGRALEKLSIQLGVPRVVRDWFAGLSNEIYGLHLGDETRCEAIDERIVPRLLKVVDDWRKRGFSRNTAELDALFWIANDIRVEYCGGAPLEEADIPEILRKAGLSQATSCADHLRAGYVVGSGNATAHGNLASAKRAGC